MSLSAPKTFSFGLQGHSALPLLARLSPPKVFSFGLIAVSILPFLIILASPKFSSAAFVLGIFGALASAHAFASAYLLTDKAIRAYIFTHPVIMIVAPIIIVFGIVGLLGTPGSPLFVWTVFAFVLYQAWHIGAQTIGVSAFVSIADRRAPISYLEKRLIQAGSVCGMLGALKIMAPSYNLTAEFMPVSPEAWEVIGVLYSLGAVLSIGLAGIAAWLACRAVVKGHYAYSVALFLSITFLFPMYLTCNFLLGFMSFTIAHGLQYLIFLSAHAVGKNFVSLKRHRLSLVMAPIALAVVVLAGYFLWDNAPTLATSQLPIIGIRIIIALTVVHFWFDQFIWKMGNPERRQWIKENYGFVLS